MLVLVDDQLALLANLGLLDLPDDVEVPLLTVYAFQVRIAAAVSVDRTTDGVLQRLLAVHSSEGFDSSNLTKSETANVRVVDPTGCVVEMAQAKTRFGCNLLAAEVVAAARFTGAGVRLSEGNADSQLLRVLTTAEVPVAIWTLASAGERLRVRELRRS